MPRILGYAIIHRDKEVGRLASFAAGADTARAMNAGVGAPNCRCPEAGCGAQYHLRVASSLPRRDIDRWRAFVGPVTLGHDEEGFRLSGLVITDPLAIILAARVEELVKEASLSREDLRRAAEGGIAWLEAHPEIYGEEAPC